MYRLEVWEQVWSDVLAALAQDPKALLIRDVVRVDLLLHPSLSPVVLQELQRQTEQAIAQRKERWWSSVWVVCAWIYARDFEEARRLADAIATDSLRYQALQRIAVAQAEANQPEGLAKTLQALPSNPNWRSGTLQKIVAALAKRGDFVGARDTIKQFETAASQFYGFLELGRAQTRLKDDAGARQSIASVVALREQVKEADAVLELAELQRSRGEADGARESLRRVVLLAQKIPQRVLRESRLQFVVEALLALGDIAPARALALSISPQGGMQAAPLQFVALAQAKRGDRMGARQTFAQAEKGLARYPSPIFLAWLAKAQWEVGERQGAKISFVKALQAARSLKPAEKKAEVLGDIAQAQAEAGDFTGAQRTLQTITDAWQKRRALYWVVAAHTKRRDIQGAKRLAGRSEHLFVRIALTQAEQHDSAGAKQTLTEALRLTSPLGSIEIMDAQVSVGDLVGATATLARLRRQRGDRTQAIAEAAARLAEAQAKTGDLAGARETARAIPEIGAQGVALCRCLLAALDSEWDPHEDAMY